LLDRLLELVDEASQARAVLIYGEGRAFCVGEDLRETLAPRTGGAEELRTSFEKLQQLTRGLVALRAPVVAAVHGYAIGGGAELAMAADFVIAAPDLKVRFPEVTLGHAVTGGISARLSAAVGLMRAKELLLTGRWVDGSELLSLGIAMETNADPVSRAIEFGRELARLPRRSMAATKAGLELATIPNQEAVLASEIDAALYCFASEDAAAAHQRFQKGQ
jgi:crotonobetaine/carnitine-CoA ligase